MLILENISKSFGDRDIVRDLSWQLPASFVGLVGPNGAGKTTLLRMLAGDDEPDDGRVIRPKGIHVGFLPQEIGLVERVGSLMDTVLRGRADLLAMESKIQELEKAMEAGSEFAQEYAELQDRFREAGGWEFRAQAREIAVGMGFSPSQFDLPITTFSGGWQMRALLARLLFRRPDVLLLDEPTNHLDLQCVEWLERFLARYEGAVVVVSHDRLFLNRMVKVIVELDGGVFNEYKGNYDAFEVARQENYVRLLSEANRQAKEIERIEAFVERFRYKATKARQAQSRLKQLDKIERIEVPTQNSSGVRFRFPQPPRLGKIAIEVRQLSKAFGENVIYKDLDLTFLRGERVALVGPNGAGKSTLLKILGGVWKADSGEIFTGSNVKITYFAQHALESLEPTHTVLESASNAATFETAGMVRDMLGAFGFSGDDVNKKVSVLSGGEKSRLAMSRLLLDPAGVLLLDEPTNHLDIDTKDVLQEALLQFEGVVIMVSHDRHFINEVASRVIHIESAKVESYLGNYDDYRWKKEKETEAEMAQQSVAPPKKDQKRLLAELRQRKSVELRELKPKLQDLEEKIARIEDKLSSLEVQMAGTELYENPEAAQRVAMEHVTTGRLLEETMLEWEKVGAEVEKIEARFAAEEFEIQR